MKKSVVVVGLILMSFLMQTCREEEPVSLQNVQFAFRATALDEAGGRTLSDLPEGSVLLVSISESDGDPVHTLKELTLLKFGDQYVSAPLPLPQGDYAITDFLIASADHDVLYATPKEGSPLASLVEHPLPITFIVRENEVTDLAVEVISINAHQPEEFGYVSFSIEVIPSEVFQLAVFISGENGIPEFTGAQAYILHEADTIYSKYLSPSVNSISFDAGLDDSYTLVLIEPSYKKYSRTFTLNELNGELHGDPLSVSLQPALTFTTSSYSDGTNFYFEFDLDPLDPSVSGTLSIDWGDGTVEEIHLPNPDHYETHTYTTSGLHFVSVSGDLDAVEHLFIFYVETTSEISTRYLPKLKELRIGAGHTPATIDLSHNKELELINFSMATFTSLDISHNPKLKSIDLSFNSEFSAESLNELIHVLFLHAVDLHMTGGGIGLVDTWPQPLIGPPSAEALGELHSLHDDYGWDIYPEDF